MPSSSANARRGHRRAAGRHAQPTADAARRRGAVVDPVPRDREWLYHDGNAWVEARPQVTGKKAFPSPHTTSKRQTVGTLNSSGVTRWADHRGGVRRAAKALMVQDEGGAGGPKLARAVSGTTTTAKPGLGVFLHVSREHLYTHKRGMPRAGHAKERGCMVPYHCNAVMERLAAKPSAYLASTLIQLPRAAARERDEFSGGSSTKARAKEGISAQPTPAAKLKVEASWGRRGLRPSEARGGNAKGCGARTGSGGCGAPRPAPRRFFREMTRSRGA
jgi:hypothetical protein